MADYHDRWSVARWTRGPNESEFSCRIVYEGQEEGARRVYDMYAENDPDTLTELRYQPPPVRPPKEVVASTRPIAAASGTQLPTPEEGT